MRFSYACRLVYIMNRLIQDENEELQREQWASSVDRSIKCDTIARVSSPVSSTQDVDASDVETQDKHIALSLHSRCAKNVSDTHVEERVCFAGFASVAPERSFSRPQTSDNMSEEADKSYSDHQELVESCSRFPSRSLLNHRQRHTTTSAVSSGSGRRNGRESKTRNVGRNLPTERDGSTSPTLSSANGDNEDEDKEGDGEEPRKTLLVAKTLTNSDASSGRIILPRVAVESNLPFVTGYRHYALSVRDSSGRKHEFVIKSWANGTEHRRVFVLEQVAEYMRSQRIGVGDTVGICADENGDLIVETNTDIVRQNAVIAARGALSVPPRGAGPAGLPIGGCIPGKCVRSVHCSKPAGHPGFCSGPKAAAAAAAATATAHAAAAAAAAKVRRRKNGAGHPSALYSEYAAATVRGKNSSGISQNMTSSGYDDMSSGEATSTGTAFSSDALPFVPMDNRLPAGLHPLAAISSDSEVGISKCLTAYDLSSQRVILPADEVEETILNAKNLNVMTLAAVDESNGWQFFTLRAWHSVVGRRGYLIEGAGRFLTARGGIPGDVLVLKRSKNPVDAYHHGIDGYGEKVVIGPPRIELRSGDDNSARQPAVPDGETVFDDMPLLLLPKQQEMMYTNCRTHRNGFDSSENDTICEIEGVRCHRTSGCTKPAGHQGFCAGHKGFKKRDGSQASTPTSSIDGRNPFRNHRLSVRSRKNSSKAKAFPYQDHEDSLDSDDDEYTPSLKRVKQSLNNSRSGEIEPMNGDPLLSLLSLLDR